VSPQGQAAKGAGWAPAKGAGWQFWPRSRGAAVLWAARAPGGPKAQLWESRRRLNRRTL
jgi:hypothetical protein